MDIGVISVRYARALLKSAVQTKCDDQVYTDMATLAKSFVDVPQLRTTINNPTIPQESKRQLLITACGPAVTPLTERFVDLVLKEGRESFMVFIASSYITLYRKQKNIIHGGLSPLQPSAPRPSRRCAASSSRRLRARWNSLPR